MAKEIEKKTVRLIKSHRKTEVCGIEWGIQYDEDISTIERLPELQFSRETFDVKPLKVFCAMSCDNLLAF